MIKILLVGSSGFLGSHLAHCLNAEIVPFDITLGNDMRDQGEVRASAKSVDVIFFFGAAAVGRRNIDGSTNVGDIEYDGLCTVAQVAADLKKPVFYASSIRVYGTTAEMTAGEHSDLHPPSVYGKIKLRCEQTLIQIMQSAGVPYYIFRMAAIYGKGMPEDFIVASFLRDVSAGKAIHLLSTGTQKRNFVHIDDVCAGFVRFLHTDHKESGIYNLAHTETIRVLDLIELCGRIMDKKTQVYPASNISPEPDETLAIEKMEKIVGWHAEITLSEGLTALYDASITSRA
ncbi:MAG: NAD(P)-dependent oxidoreductase [Candidatus Ryanbacteria bacterium]|nr:NAD(P)-dependent oxidoreductase [Candidatus Ryanbacteria bacterium]